MITTEFLSRLFPFSGLCEKTLGKILEETPSQTVNYKRGDTALDAVSQECKIGFIISGSLEVRRKKADGGHITLNLLSPTQSFGILSIFGEEDFPTEIYATRASSVLYYSKEDFLKIVREYPEVSMNTIRFLSRKITFLNRRVATFASVRVEEKLASIFLSEMSKHGAQFPFSCKKAAEVINAGRASVYRAIASLEDEGIIKFENKKIIIKNAEKLKEL